VAAVVVVAGAAVVAADAEAHRRVMPQLVHRRPVRPQAVHRRPLEAAAMVAGAVAADAAERPTVSLASATSKW
jgi:hypothetical protein